MNQYHARILIISEELNTSLALSHQLKERGFTALVDHYSVNIDRLIKDEYPDLVLLTTSGDGDLACNLAETLKDDPDTRHIPTVFQVTAPSPTLRRRCFSLGVADILVCPIRFEILLARVRPLVRLATMHAELRLRAATSWEFDLSGESQLGDGRESRNFRVLTVGAKGEDLETIGNALSMGYDITRVDGTLEAEEIIQSSQFDALVLSLAENCEEAYRLCTQVRNNPHLFNLPVLLIGDRDSFEDETVPYERGASNILYRPLQPDELQIGILTLVRRQKMRWDIREALLSTLQRETRDELTGLYSAKFFDTHLIRCVGEALRWKKHLSVARFDVKNRSQVKEQFGAAAADALFRDVSELVVSQVRPEDLVARFPENEIAVLFSETALEEAEIVVDRISGVLQSMKFAVKEAEPEALGVRLGTGVSTLKGGDSAQTVFARAKANL